MPSHLIVKEFNNELILYDTVKDEVHVLNETARFIYNLYIMGKSLEDIKNELSCKFQIKENHNTIHNDIDECIKTIKIKGLT